MATAIGPDRREGADAPATSATLLRLAADDWLDAALDPGGDVDWVAVTLAPGERAVFEVAGRGETAPGPFGLVLALRDATGALVQGETGYGAGWSRLEFTHAGAAERTLFVEVAAFGSADAGDYRLSRSLLPPVAPDGADALAAAIAARGPGWALPEGAAIAVDLSRLDPEAQAAARAGLEAWGRVTGLAFAETVLDPVAPAGILFDAGTQASFTTHARGAGGAIGMAWVTLAAAVDDRAGLADALHEIGHALGLADAPVAAAGQPLSVMQPATGGAPPLTPLSADAAAVTLLYGARGPQGAGDDVYGPAGGPGPYAALAERLAQGAALIVDAGGQDRLDFSAVAAAQRIDLAPGAVSDVAGLVGNLTLSAGTVIEAAAGGGGADTILGNGAANLLEGGGGADRLAGRAGDDTLDGGPGDDLLEGGAGADEFVFRGAGGADRVADFDRGQDRVRFAGAEAPRITREAGPEGVTLLSEDGTRMLIEGVAADALGSDSFVWAGPERLLFGTSGADTLDGGAGDDVAFGGAGDDVFRLGGGTDGFDGGGGADSLHAPLATRVRIDLSLTGPQAVAGGQITLRSVENLVGSNSGDTLLGSSAGNRLSGQGGYDVIDGRGGMDTLSGGKGRDRLYGGQDRVRDLFDFDSIYDSRPGSSRDLVFDFVSRIDRIDLSGIDANVFRRGDQAFVFSNTRPAAHAVWTFDIGRNLLVRGDVNGDARFDFEIELVAVDAVNWRDFVL